MFSKILPLLLFFATASSFCNWESRNNEFLICENMEMSKFYTDAYAYYNKNQKSGVKQFTVINVELGKIGAHFITDDFVYLSNLTLINCNIFSIDNDAFYLRNNEIKYLRIEGNKRLRNVNSWVFRNMKNLETINLSNNSITYFEFNCEQQRNVKTLILDYNQIHALISVVTSTCNSLQTVQIQNSEILSIDKNILHELPNLVSLNLYGNKLPDLNFISPHNSLSYLNLSTNYITQYNMSMLSSLTNLSVLDLSHNEMQIEYGRGKIVLSKIKTLILSYNQMTNLTSLSAFPNVEHLDLSSLNIETISENVFKPLDKLNILNLSKNKFQYINCHIFSDNRNVQYLNLSQNDLNKTIFECTNLFENVPKLIELDLSDCRIYNSINNTLFANLVNLKQMKLDHNNIIDITCPLFENNILLNGLSLSYNNLVNIPTCTFKTLLKLRSLDLSHNLILKLPIGIFSSLNNLLSLDISYNKLHSIAEGTFYPLSKLTTIDISANNFTNLEADRMVSNLRVLNEIDLSGNPWLCDNLIRIKKMLRFARVTIKSKIIDLKNNNINGVQCTPVEEEKNTTNDNNQILKELQKLNKQSKTELQDILKEMQKMNKFQFAKENSTQVVHWNSLTENLQTNRESEILINKRIDSNINRIYHVILITVILYISYKIISISFKVLCEKRIKNTSNRRSSNSTAIELLHDSQVNIN